MIGGIFAAWRFVTKMKPVHWAVVILLFVVLLLIGTCTERAIRGAFDRNNAVKVNNKDRVIREDLSVDRQKSETALVANEAKLNETLAEIPTSVPSPRRLARACHELRSDGYVELPPACRP